MTEEDAYHELSAYSLSHGGKEFVHQYVVDAYGAQSATPSGKPIRLAFALIGLYLHLDRGFDGRQVQRVHKTLGDRTHSWPAFALPDHRGTVSAADVMAAPEGDARDRAIEDWCQSVWASYAEARPLVEALLRQHGVV